MKHVGHQRGPPGSGGTAVAGPGGGVAGPLAVPGSGSRVRAGVTGPERRRLGPRTGSGRARRSAGRGSRGYCVSSPRVPSVCMSGLRRIREQKDKIIKVSEVGTTARDRGGGARSGGGGARRDLENVCGESEVSEAAARTAEFSFSASGRENFCFDIGGDETGQKQGLFKK